MLQVGLSLTACAVRAVPGAGGTPTPSPKTITAIAADGWQATMPEPADLSMAAVLALRAGFNASGAAVTHSENLLLTKRVRLPYPDQASFTADQVALSDYVYSTDAIAGVTNASAEASPKPIAAWVMPDRQLVANSIPWEIVAFHRNARAGRQVACVQVRASDGSATTPWQTVSSTQISTLCEDANPIEVYAGTLDITALATGLVTLQARVLPWIGGEASVLDSADQTAAREFSARYFLKDAARHAAPPLAYISSAGSDTAGAWSTDAASAAAAPFLTVGGAMMAMNHATRGTPATGGVMDGCRIRIVDAITCGAPTTARAQNVAALVIEPAPGTTREQANITMAGNFRPYLGTTGLTAPLTEGAVQFNGVTLTRMGTVTIMGDSAIKLHIVLADCVFVGASATNFRANAHASFYGGRLTGTPPPLGVSTGMEFRTLRGITYTVPSGQLDAQLMLGCTITGSNGLTPADTARPVIVYNNKFLHPSSANGAGRLNGTVSGADFGPLAVVQNLFETTHASSSTLGFGIGNDAAFGNLVHGVVMHNSFTGYYSAGRSNLYYDEHSTVPRFHRLIREVGNIHSQLNTKGDVFRKDGQRLGQFAYTHGVGVDGNFSQFHPNSLQPHLEVQSWPGLNCNLGSSPTERNDPLFVDYKGTTGTSSIALTAGDGGGDYRVQPASPAARLVADPVLAFDLAGSARKPSNDAAGAYAAYPAA